VTVPAGAAPWLISAATVAAVTAAALQIALNQDLPSPGNGGGSSPGLQNKAIPHRLQRAGRETTARVDVIEVECGATMSLPMGRRTQAFDKAKDFPHGFGLGLQSRKIPTPVSSSK